MKLFPFEKIGEVPNGQRGLVEISRDQDFIDISSALVLSTVRGIRTSYYTGLTAFACNNRIKFGFDKSYKIVDVEFREPFSFPSTSGLYFEGLNLFMPTLKESKEQLERHGIPVERIDVGLFVASLGVSLFSSEYEDDLDVKLEGITVHMLSVK